MSGDLAMMLIGGLAAGALGGLLGIGGGIVLMPLLRRLNPAIAERLVGAFGAGILRLIESHGRPYLLYGVTAAGVAELLGLPRICPCGRDG